MRLAKYGLAAALVLSAGVLAVPGKAEAGGYVGFRAPGFSFYYRDRDYDRRHYYRHRYYRPYYYGRPYYRHRHYRYRYGRPYYRHRYWRY